MKLTHIVVLTAAGVMAGPASFAQITCGSPNTRLQVFDAGGSDAGLNASTTRAMDPCPFEVQTEAWFSSVASPRWHVRAVTNAALNERLRHRCGGISGDSKHWLIKYGFNWEFVDGRHGDSSKPCPPPSGGDPGGPVDNPPCDPCPTSPILVDLGRNGYRLTSAAEGVFFDLDGDGKPEQVAWTEFDSDDAWLAMDRNGNGIIDSGRELFGEHTPAIPGSDQPALNGFEALAFTENPEYGVSYADALIDHRDAAVWKRLLFWRDRNHNGYSEPDELAPVNRSSVTAFSTNYQKSGRRDRHGNEFRLRGTAWWGRNHPQNIYDVWLKVAE